MATPRFFPENDPPCEGCVFIGARGGFDYYWCSSGGGVVVEAFYDPLMGVTRSVNCNGSNRDGVRRAVRGRFLSKCFLVRGPSA